MRVPCITVFLLLLILPATGCSNSDANVTIEHKMAVIQAQGSVSDNDPLVKQFADHLDSLERKTTQSRKKIADITVVAWQDIHKNTNIDDSLLETINALDNCIPDNYSCKLDFAEVAAVYMTAREKGK
ncbi:hypothetical protein LLG46_02205 [bacterium]|nr:hypothetical protein [bacterium]